MHLMQKSGQTFWQSIYVHECTHLHCYVNSLYTIFITHTHTCTLTCTHTHTHTHAHSHAHIHTQTGFVPLSVTLGSYFSLFSLSVYVHECTHLHCYVNSLYTIFVTHTQTAPPKMVHMIHNPLKPYPIARLRLNLVKCSTVLVPSYIRSICARSRLDRKRTEERKSLQPELQVTDDNQNALHFKKRLSALTFHLPGAIRSTSALF